MWNEDIFGWCNIMIYNKKYIFGLCPHFKYIAPKILGIFCAESYKVVLVVSGRTI